MELDRANFYQSKEAIQTIHPEPGALSAFPFRDAELVDRFRNALRAAAPCDRRSCRASAAPLKTAARNSPSSVIALYSTSASTSGFTHVAFGFLTGTESGEFLSISGSSFSRTSRATVSV